MDVEGLTRENVASHLQVAKTTCKLAYLKYSADLIENTMS